MADSKKTLVTFPLDVLGKIDAARGQQSRSEWITEACRRDLARPARRGMTPAVKGRAGATPEQIDRQRAAAGIPPLGRADVEPRFKK